MTPRALRKILVCLCAFGACLGVCLLIDANTPDQIADGRDPLQKSAIEDRTNSQSLLEELGDEGELSVERIAQLCFDAHIDPAIDPVLLEETFDASAFESLHSTSSLASLIYDGPLADAERVCQEQLEQKGWHALVKDDQQIHNFVKSSGSYHWLTLQYLTVGEKTSIVIHSIEPDR